MTRKRKYDIVVSLATVSRMFLKRKKGREEKTSSFFLEKTNSQHKESVTVEKKKLNEDPLTQVAELTDS